MGYALLFEGMLNDVIWARDRYLNLGGLMIPSSTTLRIAPFADEKYLHTRLGFWNDVYDYNMTAMVEGHERHIEDVVMSADAICGEVSTFRRLSMYAVSEQDLVFSKISLSNLVPDKSVHGFLIWFDTYFSSTPGTAFETGDEPPTAVIQDDQGNLAFTTGPYGPPTHWKQAILVLDEENRRAWSHGEGTMQAEIDYRKGRSRGSLDVEIRWQAGSQRWTLT